MYCHFSSIPLFFIMKFALSLAAIAAFAAAVSAQGISVINPTLGVCIIIIINAFLV